MTNTFSVKDIKFSSTELRFYFIFHNFYPCPVTYDIFSVFYLPDTTDIGVELNIIKKSGSWFSYGDTKLGQGREAVRQLFQDNPELAEEIENKIREAKLAAAAGE